jgi:4-hydroxy-tetrahydrodipicolinate synthase
MAQVCRLGLQAAVSSGHERERLVAEARALNDSVAALHKDLFLESNPVPVKWALARMGRMRDTLRLPLVELDSRFHHTLRTTMQKCGVL